jgi:hypothetical protein
MDGFTKWNAMKCTENEKNIRRKKFSRKTTKLRATQKAKVREGE